MLPSLEGSQEAACSVREQVVGVPAGWTRTGCRCGRGSSVQAAGDGGGAVGSVNIAFGPVSWVLVGVDRGTGLLMTQMWPSCSWWPCRAGLAGAGVGER